MPHVVIPKTYVEEIGDPIIFLAGPIKGAPNWQSEAITIISSYDLRLRPPVLVTYCNGLASNSSVFTKKFQM